ncbi:MAG: FtsQ-type POTRA domain-containing protein [Ferruginibacter sp.]
MLATLWIALGGATVFLLVAAIKAKSAHLCKAIEINIHGVSNNLFVDKKDILQAITLSEKSNPVGKAIGSFNLKKMELELEKNVWIRSAELFFDNNETLQVNVQEREPVARIFTLTGASFYIDQNLAMLPLSEKYSARLPVFSGFPSDRKVLIKADSSLLQDINTISMAMQKDSFCMAMIEQIDITDKRQFMLIPKMGNQLIVFGDGSDVDAKLDKLKMFYRNIMVKAGWDTYSVINLQYKNQVVAKKKGVEDIVADSLRTLQLLQMIADRAEKRADDSLQTILPDNKFNTVDSSMIQQSIQRDEAPESAGDGVPAVTPEPNNQPVTKAVKAADLKKDKKPVSKPVEKPKLPKAAGKPPKAVMEKKNEYTPIPG